MSMETLPSRHWEQKAREAHDKAKAMTSAEARQLMRDVARRYRQMAILASKRGAEKEGHLPPATALPSN
jgi:hypothetical protein